MTLSLRGNSIPTDGSGRIVITDINPDGDNDEDALICLSELHNISSHSNWFLHPTQLTTDGSVRIEGTDSRGWHRNRAELDDHRLVRLRRDDSVAIGGRALKGVFTCDIPGDINTPVSVGIYYPSESHVQSLIFKTKLCVILLLYFLFSNNYYNSVYICDIYNYIYICIIIM